MDDIHIAIYDPSPVGVVQTISVLLNYSEKHTFTIFSFLKPTMLLESDCAYDIVILEIGSLEPNGYEIACKLRQSRRNNQPIIIFATGDISYAPRGYRLALRYLLKPIRQEDMDEALDEAIQMLTANRCTFACKQTRYFLRTQDICYMESLDHFVTIYTTQQPYQFRGKIHELLKQLPQRQFAIPHKSYVVNLKYVCSVTRTTVELRDQTVIPISRSKRTAFQEKLRKYHIALR